MIALIRFLAARCIAAQCWVAPSAFFVLSMAITYVDGGDPLTTLAEGATLLFPIAAWITVTTLNDEDLSQAAVTATAGGGTMRAWSAKLLLAFTVGLGMSLLSLLLAAATNAAFFTFDDLGAGLVAHLLAVAGGVSLGSLFSRPVIARTGWSVLAITALTIVDLVVPDAPPTRIVLTALNAGHSSRLWLGLLQAFGEVALFAVALIAASSHLSRNHG